MIRIELVLITIFRMRIISSCNKNCFSQIITIITIINSSSNKNNYNNNKVIQLSRIVLVFLVKEGGTITRKG